MKLLALFRPPATPFFNHQPIRVCTLLLTSSLLVILMDLFERCILIWFDWRNQYRYVYCIWWVNKCSGLWYISIASHRWTELNFVVDSWCLMCYVVMLNVLLCRILFSRLLFQFLALKFNKWRHQGIICTSPVTLLACLNGTALDRREIEDWHNQTEKWSFCFRFVHPIMYSFLCTLIKFSWQLERVESNPLRCSG